MLTSDLTVMCMISVCSFRLNHTVVTAASSGLKVAADRIIQCGQFGFPLFKEESVSVEESIWTF